MNRIMKGSLILLKKDFRKRLKVLPLLFVSLLLSAYTATTSAGAKAIPNPDLVGPYEIGFTSFMLTDASRNTDIGGRPLAVYVWYPADSEDIKVSTSEAIYPLDPISDMVPVSFSSEWEAYGFDRAYQKPSASSEGPFPMVVFSPGWGGPALSALFLGTRLASHGFVVAVVYHYGDAFWPWEPFDHLAVASMNRPLDISFMLTHLLTRNGTPGDLLHNTIQTDQVAASGWSLGGYASMALASGDDSVCDKFFQLGYYDTPPETCVPALPDPRIRAIVTLDGSTQVLWFDELARINVPTMGIGQEWSTLAAVLGPASASWQARLHAASQGHPCYRVDVRDAYHSTFSNYCEAAHIFFDKGIIDQSLLDLLIDVHCSAAIPTEVAHRLITKYMIAFLKTNLAGEPGYQNILTPGYALTQEPYIEFFVTEKRNPNANHEDWPGYYMYFIHQPGNETAKAEKAPQQLLPIPHFGLWR